MQGISILCAMEMDYTASEHWYALLKEFLQQCSTSDAAYKNARSRLAWLDISLPQRSVEELPSKFLSLFQLMTNKESSFRRSPSPVCCPAS